MTINWYDSYDEINAELLEMAARSTAEVSDPSEGQPGQGHTSITRLFVGSGEDICTWSMDNHFKREGIRYDEQEQRS